MKIRSRSIKVGAAVAVGLAAIGVGTAYAYPPGMNLMASAVRVPTATPNAARIAVSVINGKPGCTVRAIFQGVNKTAVFSAGGTALIHLSRQGISGGGTVPVQVRTVGCTPSESYTASVNIEPASLDAPGSVRVNRAFQVSAMDWPQDKSIVCVATRSGGGAADVTRRGRTDDSGNASLGFRLPRRGSWGIVCSHYGEMQTVSLTVT